MHMKTIKSFLLDSKTYGSQQIYLPEAAEILTVNFNADNELILYALVYKFTDNYDLRYFKICETDEMLQADKIKYISTCYGEQGIIHVIELLGQ